jgi:hypothetical protein
MIPKPGDIVADEDDPNATPILVTEIDHGRIWGTDPNGKQMSVSIESDPHVFDGTDL